MTRETSVLPPAFYRQMMATQVFDSLLDVVTDAARDTGRANQVTWERAIRDGWTTEQLTESFACFAIASYSATLATSPKPMWTCHPSRLPEPKVTRTQLFQSRVDSRSRPLGVLPHKR